MKRTKIIYPPRRTSPDPTVDVVTTYPPEPTEPCWLCKESGYHLNQERNVWLCDWCHPIVLPVDWCHPIILPVETKGETE